MLPRNFSVLVVDDNAHMRTLVSTILRGASCKDIVEASDGAEALDMLRTRHVDAAIVDYRMAPIDGLEFVQLLRTAKDSPAPDLPVLMMTGHADRRTVLKAREAGISGFLAKPVSARTLLARLERALLDPMPIPNPPLAHASGALSASG